MFAARSECDALQSAGAGSLVALQLLLQTAKAVPAVTILLYFTDNCLMDLTDSALIRRHSKPVSEDLMAPEWAAWVGADGAAAEPEPMPPLSFSLAPPLVYQSSIWGPSALECRAMTLPMFDWVWPGEVCAGLLGACWVSADAGARRFFACQAAKKRCSPDMLPSHDGVPQDFTDGSPQRRDGLSVVPWEERQPQLVFRGSNKPDSIPFSNNRGLKSIRGRAAALALSHPKLLNIKLFDPGCKQSQPPNCRDADVGVQYYGRYLTWMDQVEYKYQLDLDGHGTTFRVKHLLQSGSLVFKVDSPLAQNWMSELRPWVHFIPVSWHDFGALTCLQLG